VNCVASSSSLPKEAKASTYLYWANYNFNDPAMLFIALTWAAEPTRLTIKPTLTAGRIPL
jgi:hypothetical protein